MAVVQNTLIGRSKGRVGNAIFSTWKGRNILKQKAEIVANPRTSGQVMQRAKFLMCLAYGKLLRPILQQGFREYAGTVTWLNRFMSVNMNNDFLVLSGTETWVPDFTQLQVGEGSLFPTVIAIDSQDVSGVVIEWNPAPINNQTPNDVLYAVAIGATGQAFILGDGADRSVGTANIPLASAVSDVVYIVAFFVNPLTLNVSNSLSINVTITA